MRTLAVIQARGGAGKSTVSAHLACGAADAGIQTLLIDLVPSGGSSRYLGMAPRPGAADLWDVLQGKSELHSAAIALEKGSNLRVVPAAPRLTGYEFEMRGPYRLRVALAPLRRRRIEFVILDTGPSSSLSTHKALAAADDVVLVVETKAPGLDALDRQLSLLEQVREQMNPQLRLLGIVPSRVTRTRFSRATLAALHADYSELLLPSIRESTGIAEAPLHGAPVTRTLPRSIGAADFNALTRVVLSRLGWPQRQPARELQAGHARRPCWLEGKYNSLRRPDWTAPGFRAVPKTRHVVRP